MSKIGIDRVGAALASICMLPMHVYAGSPEAILRPVLMEIGRLGLALIACIIAAPLVARGPSLARKLLFGLALLTFFASQGRSILDTYRNPLYQPRKTMSLSISR